MKNRFSIFFVFLAVLFSWTELGTAALVSDDVAIIQATQTKSTTPAYPFGKTKSLVAPNSAEGGSCTLNSLSCCNTIYDSEEDNKDTLFEEYVQRHADILLLTVAYTAIQPTIRTLLFPFHFFL